MCGKKRVRLRWIIAYRMPIDRTRLTGKIEQVHDGNGIYMRHVPLKWGVIRYMPFFHKARAILVGSLILSSGINFFLVPYQLLDGGIIGIGLIVSYLLHIKVGLTMIILSIPIFFFAWIHYRSYFYNSIHGLLVSSFMIDLLHPLHRYFHSQVYVPPVLSSIAGGILVGLGIGMMLRHDTSTGGTDLLAQFLAKIFRINVGVVIFVIDAIVICMGGLLISKETFFLSVITITFVGLTTSLCTLQHQ